MRLTRETEYALRGLLALAQRLDQSPVPLSDLAAAEDLPSSFLAKIFQKLARHGIVLARRGAGRGYSLAMPPDAITVLDIIQAVEGSDYLDRCLFWGGRCGGSSPCMLHDRWAKLKPHLEALLQETTVAELAATVQHA